MEKARSQLKQELIEDLADALSDIASPQYVSEQNWNEDAHIGKITLTVKDARRIYKLVGELPN